MHSTVKCLKKFKSTQIFYENNGRQMYCTSILYDWGMCINKSPSLEFLFSPQRTDPVLKGKKLYICRIHFSSRKSDVILSREGPKEIWRGLATSAGCFLAGSEQVREEGGQVRSSESQLWHATDAESWWATQTHCRGDKYIVCEWFEGQRHFI